MSSIRRVFITGGSSGLGRGLGDYYAREGAHMGIVARRESLLREVEKKWKSRGASVEVYPGDVSDTEFMVRCANDFVAAAGGVDLVFANAGMGIPNRTLEGESREIAQLMAVNVIGVTNTVIPFAPHMLKQGSGILCATGSMAGHRGMAGRAAYSASKACVKSFMDGLRLDLHGSGVHAMTLCPGFVLTPMTEGNGNMMFLISQNRAVEYMVGAIEARKRTYTFPWQMNILKELLSRAPETWIRKFAPQRRPR
jgi:short-subunit dehydrogenase